ncbi:hypothetical protein FD723_18655 [Nostoc sp. C052]|uniref:hypothetical protein n=1 Tax=Nostoc sp. C052 TaxID=2576902 RepID=UPI0015C30A93|nr:hypothetical protein [Nostoc sp. C052]QLE42241.1 hypothetical protein FD723_18655 [Nostoc sp. C052]
MQALHYGAKLHREELHLAELGIATLTSCFVNSNRDPKSEAAKPSDFFYFTPVEDEGDRISSTAANAFFALADAGKLPGWVVAIAPVDKLTKSRNGDPCTPLVWIGEGLVLLQPVVDNGLVRFPLGFVDGVSGAIITDGGIVKVPELGQVWVLEGEFALSC